MESLRTYHVYILTFHLLLLFLTCSDARHLTFRKSDAATRISQPLGESGVSFLGKPTRNSAVIPQVEENPKRARESSVKAQIVKPSTVNDVRSHSDARPTPEETSHAHSQSVLDSNEHHAEEKRPSLSSDEDVMIDKNSPKMDKIIAQDKNAENRIISNEVITQTSGLTKTQEPHHAAHTTEFNVRSDNSEVVGDSTENGIGRSSEVPVTTYSDKLSSIVGDDKSEQNNDVTHKNEQDNASVPESSPLQIKESQAPQEEVLDSLHHDIQTNDDSHAQIMRNPQDTLQTRQNQVLNKNNLIEDFENDHGRSSPSSTEPKIHDVNGIDDASGKDNIDLVGNHRSAVIDSDNQSNTLKPRITVFIEEKNSKNGHTQRVLASDGDGLVKSHLVHADEVVPSNTAKSSSQSTVGNERNVDHSLIKSPKQTSMERDWGTIDTHNSRTEPPVAILETAHDTVSPHKHEIETAEINTESLNGVGANAQAVDNLSTNGKPYTKLTPTVTSLETTTRRLESTRTTPEQANSDANWVNSTEITPTERTSEDVEPLSIFTNDIKYQRFPRPMSLTTLKNKVLGKPLKKLYILEESKKKLFQHVRQLEAVYTVENEVLYVSFLFRFVFSRKCQEIEKFKMGKLVGNTDLAMFEKETTDGQTERILFFSERPEDYVFFMSCTDMKNSPYACRDSYYVTLDSVHDPPNQFPWGEAARELKSKMDLTFEDPRFLFNFVLLPCARKRSSS